MRKVHIPLAPGTGPRTTWLIGLAAFVLLACAAAWRVYPPLPRTLALRIVFPEVHASRIEPLISAGAFEAADFLDVRYEGPAIARFGYDYWGRGGPVSEPFSFVPGRAYPLEIEMPALAKTRSFPGKPTAPLRVVLDGRELLRAGVPFHSRDSTALFFGENPIGGTTDGLTFQGKILTEGGRELRGGPKSYFSAGTRLTTWFAQSPWHVLLIALASAAIALALPWLVAWCAARPAISGTAAPGSHAVPHHGWFVGTTIVCVLVFTWVLTGGGWTLIYEESFANFYDYQALSLLHGRLDVPEGALSGEAFWFDGKCYGYFGPTPAILRLPLIALGIGFAHLSRAFMLIDFIVALAGAYAVLCHAVRMVAGAGKYPSRFAAVAFTASVGLGSTLFFLSGRAYIYHEAILCGAMFAIWSSYCALRFLQAPESRWWIGALMCGLAAVHARPPIGLFALSLLGTVAGMHFCRSLLAGEGPSRANRLRAGSDKKPFAIGALSALSILSYNGVSYLKFGTIEGCPLRYNVQYSPERLAKIDGKQFHWSNVPFSLDAYFLKPALGVGSGFPYFHMREVDDRNYPRAKMDLTEPMTGVPYAMPALFLLAFVAIGSAMPRGSPVRTPLIVLSIAAAPMALALFAAIAVSHRYTADFLGFFLSAAAFGLAWIDHGSGRWRKVGRVLVGIATVLGAGITIALTLDFQGTLVWGQPQETLEHYHQLRERVEHATKWLRST